jgi:hypothetical protein
MVRIAVAAAESSPEVTMDTVITVVPEVLIPAVKEGVVTPDQLSPERAEVTLERAASRFV